MGFVGCFEDVLADDSEMLLGRNDEKVWSDVFSGLSSGYKVPAVYFPSSSWLLFCESPGLTSSS